MATDRKAFLLQKRFIEFALGESGGKASDPYSYVLEKILKFSKFPWFSKARH